jgi:hypothetical protein
MKRWALFAFLALMIALTSRPALAWNSVGHMSVAYLAYQKLTPAEKARVAVLLKLNPYYDEWLSSISAGTTEADRDMYVFMMAATWPDQIKARSSGYTGTDTPPRNEPAALNDGYEAKQAHKYWHYVNTPLGSDNGVAAPLQEPDIVEKIGVLKAALATGEPDALKSYDLVWLMHLVGDIHQPLHCVTRVSATHPDGDRGGNLVLLNGPEKNLHFFWDDVLGEGNSKDFAKAVPKDFAKVVQVAATLPKPNRKRAMDDKESDWARESFALARKNVYAKPVGSADGPYTLTAAYTKQATKIADLRIALAGARLANLLKSALQCSADTCAH